MTKDEKIEFLSRLFMYVSKVGYYSDIEDVEYFVRSISDHMGMNTDMIRPIEYLDDKTYELSGTEESVIDSIRTKLRMTNP